MSFFESPRFPERIGFGAVGGPEFATDIVTVESGREKRNARWSYPRHAWDVSHGVRTQADFDTLRAHFLSCAGRAHGFRFKDFSDFQASITEGKAVALTSTTFQLVKRYTSGSQTRDRLIRKPIASGFVILVSGSPPTYTLDATTGVVTIAAAPSASAITWSGEFDVPMRYDTDALRGEVVSRNGSGLLYNLASIPLVEDVNA